MQNRLFRRSALERLSSPEQLDLLMQVTSPRAWLILLGLVVILAAVIVWGFTGSIATTVAGEGILLRGGTSITNFPSPATGILNDIYVNVEDVVESGQIIARIQDETTGENTAVRSTFSGRILEILVSQDSLLRLGQSMMIIEPIAEDTDLEAVIYLPATEGKKVRPGMPVQLLPATVRAEEVGVMLGWVISVGEFPESQESMNRVMENDDLTTYFFSLTDSAPIEIRVTLVPHRHTATGYKWTTPNGPAEELRSGTLTQANIIIDQQSPVNLIFGGAGQG